MSLLADLVGVGLSSRRLRTRNEVVVPSGKKASVRYGKQWSSSQGGSAYKYNTAQIVANSSAPAMICNSTTTSSFLPFYSFCLGRSVSPHASEVPTLQEDSAEEVMLKVGAFIYLLSTVAQGEGLGRGLASKSAVILNRKYNKPPIAPCPTPHVAYSILRVRLTLECNPPPPLHDYGGQ